MLSWNLPPPMPICSGSVELEMLSLGLPKPLAPPMPICSGAVEWRMLTWGVPKLFLPPVSLKEGACAKGLAMALSLLSWSSN